jgi:hypothetical protein
MPQPCIYLSQPSRSRVLFQMRPPILGLVINIIIQCIPLVLHVCYVIIDGVVPGVVPPIDASPGEVVGVVWVFLGHKAVPVTFVGA